MYVDPQKPGDGDHGGGGAASALVQSEDDHLEEKTEKKLNNLLSIFPNTDPGNDGWTFLWCTVDDRNPNVWKTEQLRKLNIQDLSFFGFWRFGLNFWV